MNEFFLNNLYKNAQKCTKYLSEIQAAIEDTDNLISYASARAIRNAALSLIDAADDIVLSTELINKCVADKEAAEKALITEENNNGD